jgi:peptidoglycan/LPS O-acetylase OafA/YrhL
MTTQELLAEGLVPTPGKRAMRRGLHPLTGLRFFAAFYVMTFHFGAAFTARAHMPRPVTVFLQHGNLGVALFFILSGFILYYSYKGNLRTPRDLYKFFVARFARLYPVYLLVLLVALFIDMRLPHGQEFLIITMMQSWLPAVSYNGYAVVAQAWTLSVEAFFYCCFPFLLLLFDRNLSPRTLWLMTTAIFALAVGIQSPLFHSGMRPPTWLATHMLLPLLCLPEFLFGMVLGALFLQKQRSNPRSSSNDWITVAGIIPCFLIIGSPVGGYLISLAGVFCFGWTIYRLADGRGWLSDLLSSKFLMLLGGASFSIYLFQAPNRIISRRLFGAIHPGLDAALAPFILISMSCLIFLFYEEPLRDLIRKLLTRKQTVPDARHDIAASKLHS